MSTEHMRRMPRLRTFEFSFPRLETLVRVEPRDGGVVIRASRNSFSAPRKLSFIRELIAEGFIEEVYLYDQETRRLCWIVDPQLTSERRRRTANRFMVRSLCGVFVLWLVLLVLMFLGVLSKAV